jgi:succinate dehydrogenase/fumarate reductase flavoprotein subunit
MLATARWIYASALQRRETRGIHRRRDYPRLNPGKPGRLAISGMDGIMVENAP